MPYTRITRTRDGKAAIRYVMNRKGHNEAEARNEIVSGINMLPDAVIPFSIQMDKVWQKASSKNKVRVHRIVQSFSLEELDPDNPEDVAIAHEIGVRTARELYGKDCQCIVATQTDGNGHLVHNHILVSNVTLSGVGLINERTFHPTIRKTTDTITAQFIDIPDPEPATEVISPEVRGMRVDNEDAEEGDTRYIWQDDLRQRIRDAIAEAKDMADFFRQLLHRGVKGTLKKATKKQPEHILYELTDVSGFDPEKVPRNLKSKSYKMGLDFQPESIMDKIRQKQIEKGDDKMSNIVGIGERPDLAPIQDLSKLKNKEAVADAEDSWSAIVRTTFAEYRGWGSELPMEKDPVLGSVIDPDAIMKRAREYDDFELHFRLYQNDLRKYGVDIPTVFHADKYETVVLDREELRRQVQEFIKKEYASKCNASETAQGKKAAANIPKKSAGGTQKGRKKQQSAQQRTQTPEERIKMAERVSAGAEEYARQQHQDQYELEY